MMGMLHWNYYYFLLEEVLKNYAGPIPTVYFEIIGPWIDDAALEQIFNPFIGC